MSATAQNSSPWETGLLPPWKPRPAGEIPSLDLVDPGNFEELLGLCHYADQIGNLAGIYEAHLAFAAYYGQQRPDELDLTRFVVEKPAGQPTELANPREVPEACFIALPRWMYDRYYWLLRTYFDEESNGRQWFRWWDRVQRESNNITPVTLARSAPTHRPDFDGPPCLPRRMGVGEFLVEVNAGRNSFLKVSWPSGIANSLKLFEEHHLQVVPGPEPTRPLEATYLPLPHWLMDGLLGLFWAVLERTETGRTRRRWFLQRQFDLRRHLAYERQKSKKRAAQARVRELEQRRTSKQDLLAARQELAATGHLDRTLGHIEGYRDIDTYVADEFHGSGDDFHQHVKPSAVREANRHIRRALKARDETIQSAKRSGRSPRPPLAPSASPEPISTSVKPSKRRHETTVEIEVPIENDPRYFSRSLFQELERRARELHQ